MARRELRRRCDHATSASAKRPDTRTSALLSLFSATARLLQWRKQTTLFRSSSLLCLPAFQGAGDAQIAAWVGVSIKGVSKRCHDLAHVRHRRLKCLRPAGAQAVLLPRHWERGQKARARPARTSSDARIPCDHLCRPSPCQCFRYDFRSLKLLERYARSALSSSADRALVGFDAPDFS